VDDAARWAVSSQPHPHELPDRAERGVDEAPEKGVADISRHVIIHHFFIFTCIEPQGASHGELNKPSHHSNTLHELYGIL